MASGVYTLFKKQLMMRLHDLVNDTVKVALYGVSFSFNAASTNYSATNETAGTGYTAGGASLAGNAVSTIGTVGFFDANDTSWSSATFSAYFAVIYDQTPCNTLICAIDFGGIQQVTSGTFTLTYASSGILVLA